MNTKHIGTQHGTATRATLVKAANIIVDNSTAGGQFISHHAVRAANYLRGFAGGLFSGRTEELSVPNS